MIEAAEWISDLQPGDWVEDLGGNRQVLAIHKTRRVLLFKDNKGIEYRLEDMRWYSDRRVWVTERCRTWRLEREQQELAEKQKLDKWQTEMRAEGWETI